MAERKFTFDYIGGLNFERSSKRHNLVILSEVEGLRTGIP